MKYSPLAHAVNILFLALFVLVPVIYCLHDLSLSKDTVGLILFFTFMFGIIIFADWYHMYITNTFTSIILFFVLGITVAAFCVLLASFVSDHKIIELITFKAKSWEGERLFLRFYVTGVGIAVSAVYSIPRLILIKLLTNGELPTMAVKNTNA